MNTVMSKSKLSLICDNQTAIYSSIYVKSDLVDTGMCVDTPVSSPITESQVSPGRHGI